MKIAFTIPSLSNHGPNVFTLNLVNSLLELGLSTTVLYFGNRIDLNFPVECKRIDFMDYKVLKKFDLVHSTMLRADLFSAVYKQKSGPVIVSGIHNFFDQDLRFLYPTLKSKIATALWRWSLLRIGNAIVSSEQMKKYYLNAVDEGLKIKVIPYGVNRPPMDDQLPLELLKRIDALRKNRFKIVGSCGLLIRRKGYDTLLRAAALIDNIAIVIIGDGPERTALGALADSLSISDRVIFLGQQPNSSHFYSCFDIFAMTSLSEGFGIAMLEALALELPLVCSNLEIYNGYFSKNNVALFEPGDTDGLRAAIIRALSESAIMRVRSSELYTNNFKLDLMAQRHFEYYKNLIEKD